jgi:hypothetical protein
MDIGPGTAGLARVAPGTGRRAILIEMRVLHRIALAAEIGLAYARSRWLLSRRDLPATLRALRPRTAGSSAANADGVQAGLHLAQATGRLLEALPPADSRCLMRSLVVSRLLDRRRIPSAVVIGVTSGEAFGAHAWVEVAGHPVLEPGDGSYLRLVEL